MISKLFAKWQFPKKSKEGKTSKIFQNCVKSDSDFDLELLHLHFIGLSLLFTEVVLVSDDNDI